MTRFTCCPPIGLLSLLLVVSGSEAQTQPSAGGDAPLPAAANNITLRIVDPGGKPLDRVLVRTEARTFYSDANGVLSLPLTNLLRYGQRSTALYALDGSRTLVGLLVVSHSDAGQQKEFVLAPACRLHGRLSSPALEKLGRKLSWANVYVFWKDHRPLSSMSEQGGFEFLLPPGEFHLDAYGTDTFSVFKSVEIKAGELDKSLDIELPADRLAQLIGQPAPELREIKGWHGGPAVKLADLRGKVVLLDFWGWWCGPCVQLMPELIELHHQYADRGLVIIAIHDDSLASIDELNKKLDDLQQKRWGGKTIPFRVALAGGGNTKIEGTDMRTTGATPADYGVTGWPTTILVGKDGKLIGRYDRAQIEKLLGPPSTSAPAEEKPVSP